MKQMKTSDKKQRVQIWVPQELYTTFKQSIKPLKVGDCISSYMRIVVSSKDHSLIEVVDEGLKEFIKKS
jgi:hypothetical protein